MHVWKLGPNLGEGLMIGRIRAMREAGVNKPAGKGYNRAYGEWMSTRHWARELDKPTRAHLFWCMDHRNKIEAWRDTLAQNERARLNHPSAMKRRYEAAHVVKEGDAKPTVQSPMAKLKAEIVRLEEEKIALRKRADADGSLFNLKTDRVADIANTIAGTVPNTGWAIAGRPQR